MTVKSTFTLCFLWVSVLGRSVVRTAEENLHREVDHTGRIVRRDVPKEGRRLYYWRDNAGFSNVRLQFETMVATAAAFNRTLMIPPPSKIAHLNEPFRETNAWKEEALARTISISLLNSSDWPPAKQKWCPDGAYSIQKLTKVSLASLPEDKDWCFGQFETRIYHFECLDGLSAEQQKLAETAVFNGLQIQDQYAEAARRDLNRLGLTHREFVAAHLRLGDFEQIHHWTVQDFTPTLNEYAKGQPLLIVTDDATGKLVEQIRESTQASQVRSTAELVGRERFTLQGALTDMLLCSMAGTFVGSPGSTFSNTIDQLRKKASICQAKTEKSHFMLTYDHQPHADVETHRSLWFDAEHLRVVSEKPAQTDCIPHAVNWIKTATFSALDVGKAQCNAGEID